MRPEVIDHKFQDSELIIGLVGAVGTDLTKITNIISEKLNGFEYKTEEIRISRNIIEEITEHRGYTSEYERIKDLMDKGDYLRTESSDYSILALGAASEIKKLQEKNETGEPFNRRYAYILNSLKHPDEVSKLREIYTDGFFLIGVYANAISRHKYLHEEKHIPETQVKKLMNRDEYENESGQRTSDTFHLSDFFIHIDENDLKLKESLWRIIDIIFGDSYKTPTFDEFAMFMAFSSALNSADLSRQVGAVITRNEEIIAVGYNDCPKYGGGLYRPYYDTDSYKIVDHENGRDFKRGIDSNTIKKAEIIKEITDLGEKEGLNLDKLTTILSKSSIDDITEYGRVVHAEMEALLACARNNVISKGADLYCTTFPCHNCAKHIIAAGIKRVVYVEPYPKSKALEFHDDAICVGMKEKPNNKIHFEPFIGVGPRRFFDLFSIKMSSGYAIKRKENNGNILDWESKSKILRTQLLPASYLDKETEAASIFKKLLDEISKGDVKDE